MLDRYAVIGNPIAHSKSPWIHHRFAEQTGQRLEYRPLLAPLEGFAQTVARFRAGGGRGLNVTVPFKQQALELADRVSARAGAAGAANTLVFEATSVFAENTDGVGLCRDLTERIGVALDGARVLLLGAGGAARGVIGPLVQGGVASIHIANRSPDRAHRLAEQLAPRLAAPLTGGALDAIDPAGRYDLIINATAAGLTDQAPPLVPELYRAARLAIDLVYAAAPTAFMRAARQAGCPQVDDGLGMLVEQAAESFFIWRGVRPHTAPIYQALRAGLS